MITYYDILEVSRTASSDVIHASYKTLAKKYHPDLFRDDYKLAEEKMKQLNIAYNILIDDEKRKQYDMFLDGLNKMQNNNSTQYENRSSSSNQNSEVSYKHKKMSTNRKHLIVAITMIVLSIAISGFFCINYYYSIINSETDETIDSSLDEVIEPASGTILYGTESKFGSEIKITASYGSSCVVKLKNLSGDTYMSFYVRAGDSVTVGVPARKMLVYFASGETWYGNEYLFGENTCYSKDGQICDFGKYTFSYSLYPVSSGNFSQTKIDKDEF